MPLVIHAPRQSIRQDISALTSNVDLLPTLASIAGVPLPDWCEGQPLPGINGAEVSERDVFVLEAKANPAYGPLRKASLALLRGPYKLVHYLGYKYYPDNYEFYDLANDPEELQNQYPDHPASQELKTDLDQRLAEINQPFG